MDKKYDIIIVGGGASGITGGIFAAKAGLKVLIVERLKKAGRKILATGGGRCNLTRNVQISEFLNGYYGKKNFIRTAMYDFLPEDVVAFFNSLGLDCAIENEKVYPKSFKSADVLNTLLDEYNRLGGEFILDFEVTRVLVENGCACGVCGANQNIYANSVLIAGGGCSMKDLGSNGSCFDLARRLGHEIIKPSPALVGLVVPALVNCDLAGISLSALVKVGSGKRAVKFSGDILFTHKGLSGPVILDLSRFVSNMIMNKGTAEIKISWGGYNKEYWEVVISRERVESGKKSFYNLICEYFPKRFVSYIFDVSNVNKEVALCELKNSDKDKLVNLLTESSFIISKTEGFSKSMVTCGGVSVKEINSKTMKSKVVDNLYFAGEVIDVDGMCGGYNLQWAFSSAHLAIKSIVSNKY